MAEPQEVRYWSKALGVTAGGLLLATKAVGPTVEAVRCYLSQQVSFESLRRQLSEESPALFVAPVSQTQLGPDSCAEVDEGDALAI